MNEIFLNYLIHTIKDLVKIKSFVVQLHKFQIKVWPFLLEKCVIKKLEKIFMKYHQIKNEDNFEKSWKNRVNEEYKKVLDFYNIEMIKDEIIQLLQTDSSISTIELERLLFGLPFNLFEKMNAFDCSEIVIFFITINYFKSELFQKHWLDAKQSNKQIFFALLEEIAIEESKYEVKIFHLYKHESDDYFGFELKKIIKEIERHFRMVIISIIKNYFENKKNISTFLKSQCRLL